MLQKNINIFSSTLSGRLLFPFIFLIVTNGLIAQSTWSTTNCPRSQKEAAVWYFGEKAGMDFRFGSAVPLTDQNVMTAFKASSSICDSMGNLLFFTNGDKVWDRTFTLMPNATDLTGDLGATQPCIIVPFPGDSSLYYVFTVDILRFTDSVNFTTKGLCVTLIDMKLRDGLGDARSGMLNTPVLSPVTQKITAVKHRNGKDYWLIAHAWESDQFYAWLLSRSGIASPVISAIGSVHGGHRSGSNNAIGYMKASPDGNKLALAIANKKVIELFNFNNETGEISNPNSYTSSVNGINPYGIEFSPDSRALYATIFEIGGNEKPSRPSYIYQFEIKNGLSNPVVIDSIAGVRIAAMQLATDGRIYLSRTNNIPSKRDSLDVIYNPNRLGKACNFNLLDNIPDSRFDLQSRKSIYSLPNIVQSFVNIPTFSWDSVCHNDVTQFHITNDANSDSVAWDFGDGGISFVPDPVHEYSDPGVYPVKLTEYFNGAAYLDSMMVTNYRLPVIALPDTILLYKGSSVNLRAGGGFMEYLWSNKSTDSIINVGNQGSYRVKVKDNHCCINSDTAFVKVFEYLIPNAFSPNGDKLNDVFRVNGLYKNINFKMIIYDQWGRLVFESDNIDKGWDGMFGGKYLEPDTFVWIVTISIKGQDILMEEDLKFKGTVTLVR